jgi:signal transduction histidine kinase
MILLPMLVAVFAMAGVHHVLIWMRNTVAREHLWFGVASLLAAGSCAIDWLPPLGASASWILAAQHVRVFLAAGWFAAVTWFTVEYASSGYRQRRAALLATLLLAVVCVGYMSRLGGSPQSPLLLLAALPVAVLLWLVVDGALRLWASARRSRAVSLGALGSVLCLMVLQGARSGSGFAQFPEPSLYAFLLVIVAVAYEFAGTIADGEAVSQRQRQELAHASRLSVVGELTASIAHEINQPLGAILSNADAGEILLDNPDPPLDEIRKILGDIRRDGLRASGVIRHVRTLVRKRELELERLDANVVAADVIALLEPEARRRRIAVASALSPQATYLYGDRALMEQVHINLILNAMDAVEAASAGESVSLVRPPIVLGVSTTPHGEIEFRISDAGTGIPTEQLGHLFDSFYTSKPHGMGLGLSIARSIVEAHGGRIQADNNRDAGATFRVTLPPYSGPGGQVGA